MFNLFRTRPPEQVIDRGRVACPARGSDVEIDQCAACRWLESFDDTAAIPAIRCQPERASGAFI